MKLNCLSEYRDNFQKLGTVMENLRLVCRISQNILLLLNMLTISLARKKSWNLEFSYSRSIGLGGFSTKLLLIFLDNFTLWKWAKFLISAVHRVLSVYFFSGFITALEVNPPETKLAKCTSMQCSAVVKVVLKFERQTRKFKY